AAYARLLKLSGLAIGSRRGDTAAPPACGAARALTLPDRGIPSLMAGIQYFTDLIEATGAIFLLRTTPPPPCPSPHPGRDKAGGLAAHKPQRQATAAQKKAAG